MTDVVCCVPWPTEAYEARSLETGEVAIVLTARLRVARPKRRGRPPGSKNRRPRPDKGLSKVMREVRHDVLADLDAGMTVAEACYRWELDRETVKQWREERE